MKLFDIIRKLLMQRKFYCIFCGKLIDENEIEVQIKTGQVGACLDCMSRLPFTGYGSSYEGTESVRYILSPFYYEGSIPQAIRAFKFNGMHAYSAVFAEQMIDYLEEYPKMNEVDFIIPVPLSKERLWERGYNQSELLSEKIATHFQIPTSEHALQRVKNTKKQSTLGSAQRYENVKDAFYADSTLVHNKRIMLVDDIVTTGSTLQACAKTLLNAGAKDVIAVTLSYVYRPHQK